MPGGRINTTSCRLDCSNFVKEDVSGVGVGLLKAQGVEQGPVLKYTQNYMYNIHNMQNMQNI